MPPVLELQLKRYKFDPRAGDMVKVADRLTFDDELDVRDFVDDPKESETTYLLQAVRTMRKGTAGGRGVR